MGSPQLSKNGSTLVINILGTKPLITVIAA
jgi:hypothetical protein